MDNKYEQALLENYHLEYQKEKDNLNLLMQKSNVEKNDFKHLVKELDDKFSKLENLKNFYFFNVETRKCFKLKDGKTLLFQGTPKINFEKVLSEFKTSIKNDK